MTLMEEVSNLYDQEGSKYFKKTSQHNGMMTVALDTKFPATMDFKQHSHACIGKILVSPVDDDSTVDSAGHHWNRIYDSQNARGIAASKDFSANRGFEYSDHHSYPTDLTHQGQDIKSPTGVIKFCKDEVEDEGILQQDVTIPTMKVLKIQSRNEALPTGFIGQMNSELRERVESPAPTRIKSFRPNLKKPTLMYEKMAKPVQLIDEQFQWMDTASEFLSDQNDYLVVGVVGKDSVGKSSILSILSGDSEKVIRRGTGMFSKPSDDGMELWRHSTLGVEMLATSDRLILLDSHPVLSSSVMLNSTVDVRDHSNDSSAYLRSLELTAFMMTVCNVVVVVIDWFIDQHLIRLLETAQMLRPSSPAGSSDHEKSSFSPHIVFVLNKVEGSNFSAELYESMQQRLGELLKNSQLNYKGMVHMAQADMIPGLLKERCCGINLFMMPKISLHEVQLSLFIGRRSIQYFLNQFVKSMMCLPRNQFVHVNLSEKNWLTYAARSWDAVRKSKLLTEYSRLLT